MRSLSGHKNSRRRNHFPFSYPGGWRFLFQQETVLTVAALVLVLLGVYVLVHALRMGGQIREAKIHLSQAQQEVTEKSKNNQLLRERIHSLSSPEGQEQWARENKYSRQGEVVYFLQSTSHTP
jgi:cell division protein FtsB